MNGCIPDWKMEDEKRYIGPDNELLELLWRNGQLVMHNQTNCRTLPTISESKQAQKPGASLGNSSNFVQEDETAPWFQYPLDNSIEKEFSEFLCGMSAAEPIGANKTSKEEERCAQLHPSIDSINACAKQPRLHLKDKVMLPPKPLITFGSAQQIPSAGNGAVEKFSSHSKAGRADLGSANRNFCEEASSSGIVVGGSNTNTARVVKDCQLIYDRNDLQSNTYETLIASSSGLQSTTSHGQKRKGRDAEESEGHSEETGYESAEANKTAQRPAYGRRSRAAEVHNLSERRRRDKINEKMKALQELIPHCNKTDKASMLDEAIEYLKSLQLQLQIMWTGNGMGPILFPSLHQYMSLMDIGMGQHSLPSDQNPVQLPIAPPDNHSIPNQPPACPPLQAPSSVDVPNQMQESFHLPEPYPRYFSFPQMQVPPPQVMNMSTNGQHIMQQNQIASAAEKQQHASIKSSIGQSG